jgi:hypothetical protein
MSVRADDPETTGRAGLVVGLVLGLPILAVGIRGVLVDAADTHPVELAGWIVGAAAVHDLVLAPVVVAVGGQAGRLPVALQRPLRFAVLATASLVLIGWPLVRGYGRSGSVPSLLPRDYGRGLAVAVGVVWLVAVGAAAVAARRRRDGGDDGAPGTGPVRR